MSKLDKKALRIEEEHNRKLTNRQKEFARHYVDGTQYAKLKVYLEHVHLQMLI